MSIKKEEVDFIRDVLKFHRTFEHPVLDTPQIPNEKRRDLRISLLQEELRELEEASESGNIVECADAFADLMYVLCGAILEYGLGDRFYEVFAEVQRSNMSKACSTEDEALQTMAHFAELGQGAYHKFNTETGKWNVFRESDNKLLKSINYSPANLQVIVMKEETYEEWNARIIKDVSIHFTTKGQTVEEIDNKLSQFIDNHKNSLPFDFSEPTSPRSVLHHCFLPKRILLEEKGFSKEVYDVVLDPLSEQHICWKGVSDYGLAWDRRLMLENIAKLKGISLFIGELKGEVLEEYNIAKELGIQIIHIQ